MSTDVSPPSKRVRLTISVSQEVHETFTRLAKSSGTSISHQMGEWLADTLDAAEHMTTLVEKARAAPGLLARELHAYSLGITDELSGVIAGMSRPGLMSAGKDGATAKRAAAAARGAGSPSVIPPPSNTGGKVPAKGRK